MNQISEARIIVVTGVTRGLGRAMAEGFAALGHIVLGCGRQAERVAELRQALGAPHEVEVVDVADGNSVERWAEGLLARHGAPDFLINNAAVGATPAPLWEMAEADIAQILDINLKGTINTIRSFTPALIKAGRGVIVNFSSGWGRSTDPHVAAYCATKWAIEGLTQALSKELPVGLAAVALNPGIINTDMLQQCFGEEAAKYPRPDEWARRAVPFILRLGPRHNGRPSLSVPGARLEAEGE